MITINLTRATTAESCGLTATSRKTGSPIHKLCRALIDAGHAAHDLAIIQRDGRTLFNPARLSFWAERDTTEGDGSSARFIKHKPLDADHWS